MWKCELRALRSLLWLLAEDLSWSDLGSKSGLCHQTMRRFFDGVTKNPSYRTVSQLCRAVGVTITIEKDRVSLRRAA